MKKMKDLFWIWGQDVSSHQRASGNARWKLPDKNKMGPVEGAAYLGIPNLCRVVMCGNPEPPFDAESEKMRGAGKVVWSAMGDSGSERNNHSSDLEEVLRQAALYPNITGAVLDDFFVHYLKPVETWARYSVEEIRRMKARLHAASPHPLEFWVVWYKGQLHYQIADYLREFDVITYWNMMAPAEHALLQEDLDRMVQLTPGNRRMTGCYIWNYGEGKPLTRKEIQFECETYYGMIKKGLSEGIIFCSNCCADLPEAEEAVSWLRGWIREVGEETV